MIRHRILPGGRWDYTDDTQMALSVIETLLEYGTIDQDKLAQSFADHFDPTRGYGPAMYRLLPNIQKGLSWRVGASGLFGSPPAVVAISILTVPSSVASLQLIQASMISPPNGSNAASRCLIGRLAQGDNEFLFANIYTFLLLEGWKVGHKTTFQPSK